MGAAMKLIGSKAFHVCCAPALLRQRAPRLLPALQRLPVAAGAARATFPRVWGIEMRIAPPPRARRLRWARRPQRGGRADRATSVFFCVAAFGRGAARRRARPDGTCPSGGFKGPNPPHGAREGLRAAHRLVGGKGDQLRGGQTNSCVAPGRLRSRKRALMAVPLCGVTDLVQGTPHSPQSAACGKSMLIPSLRGRGMPSFWPARRMVGASA